MPAYPGDDEKDSWESKLLEEIQRYIVQVWTETGRPAEVLLAVDGVVPMAKIRQQRMRRFKSAWLADLERKEGIRGDEASWDTNCITPGTAFMEKLSVTLHKLCAMHKGWSVSDSQEPGEGEHKIMKRLRSSKASADPIVIYGLDADLILLTMLNAKAPAYLMREVSEMGIVQTDTLGKEEYSFLSMDMLKDVLVPSGMDKQEWITNYIAAMSLLGNDFLPHSCSITLKQDGHTILLQQLAELYRSKQRICRQENSLWNIDFQGLQAIFQNWSLREERDLCSHFKKKIQLNGKVTTYNQLERMPLEWAVEKAILLPPRGEDSWRLVPGWQTFYRTQWLQAGIAEVNQTICQEYMYGLQWILDYYTGQRPVPSTWYFTRSVPPLWSDLLEATKTSSPNRQCEVGIEGKGIETSEQLAMVLPLKSWHFIRKAEHKHLPTHLPQFWPQDFEMMSVGRWWLWECEPKIPILTLDRLRSVTGRNTGTLQ